MSRLKTILLVVGVTLVYSCQKSVVEQKKISSQQFDNTLVKRPPVPWYLPKEYVYHYTDNFTAYQGLIKMVRKTCYTSAGARDTVGRVLQAINIISYPLIASYSKTYKTYAQASVLYANWNRVSSQRFDNGTGDPAGYQYSVTYYHDYTYPQANYMITIYYNMSNGHVTNAYVRTDTYGFGNANSYMQINDPVPYITTDWSTNTITWSAEGIVNVGVNLDIFGVSGLNFTSNVPVGFYGYIMVDEAGGVYSHTSVAGAGAETKHKAQVIVGLQ